MARTVGATNKSTRDVKALMDEVSSSFGKGDKDGTKQALHRLFERAHGIQAQRIVDGEVVVYEVPPDTFAIKTLLEFRFGKPKEHIEIEDPNEKFKGLPQLLIVAPKGWTGKYE